MNILRPALLAFLALAGTAPAADFGNFARTLHKEPVYHSKSPRYALLTFGPEAKDRVWLVHDGDLLYVDRNGSADLTMQDDAGHRVSWTYQLTEGAGGSHGTGYDFDPATGKVL